MMTRFKKEISGQLGDFWVKHAKQEVEQLVKQAKTEATVENDGAIKWNSSGNYLPDDCCEKLEYANFDFSRQATAIKRDAQFDEFVAQYRANKQAPSEEELFGMRAAFGPGATVVDVLTGEQILL